MADSCRLSSRVRSSIDGASQHMAFRSRLIAEVESQARWKLHSGDTSMELGKSAKRSSLKDEITTQKTGVTPSMVISVTSLDNNHTDSDNQTFRGLNSMESGKSSNTSKRPPLRPMSSQGSQESMTHGASRNSAEDMLGLPQMPMFHKTSSNVTKPLRHCSHISRGSITGSQLVEAQSLTVTLPGKVGSEDDKVVVGAGMKSLIRRTHKVHRNKRGVKKILAQRRLGNLENEDDDANKDIGKMNGQEVTSVLLEPEERKSVLKVLGRHFLFSSLSAGERDMLIEQMLHVEKQKGDVICTMGDKGDDCYIILTGICSVVKDGTQVASLSAGHTFGELSLLYDVPRTATIECLSPRVVLSVIRGATFRRSLARAKERTLNETLHFLNTHDIFSKLTVEEKMMLANALSSQTYEPGALLIDENISNTAEWMFLIQEGSVEVTDQYKNRKILGECATISGNQMPYGEKAVLAKVLTSVKCYAIGYGVLNRLFGNIAEVLRRSTVRCFLESSVPFFAELTDKQQMIVAAIFQDHNVRKGEVIVSMLADPQLVLVLEGEVIITDILEAPVKTSASGRVGKPDGAPGELDGICPVPQDKQPSWPQRTIIPEIDLPEVEDCPAGMIHETSILHRGHVFGTDTFREGGRTRHSLVARTDGIICRAGHDEVCRSLRGTFEKTLPLRKIIQLNYVKKRLQTIFPFSALYNEMLDMVIQNFCEVEHAPGASICQLHEDTKQFCLIVEGEAVRQCEGETPRPLERWSSFGTRQLLLNAPNDAEITAAATGCTVMAINQETFNDSANVLFAELQSKCWYQDLQIGRNDIMYSKKLGEGQFGVVFKVFVRGVSGENFALKCMSKRKILDLEQQQATKLEREILSEFCHPLIVRLIVTFQDEHSVYLLMENIQGGDLFTAIRDIGNLTEEHVLFFGASIVLAIEYVHSRGIIYRDLKPENVMVADDGHLRLVDFGCCSRKQRSYTFVGTPEYLAPEVVLGKGYGKAVDWWSLGVIMYEMICGPLPFGENCNDPLDVFREVLEKELSVPPKVTPEGADLLTSLLERMPEQRLGSATLEYKNEVREHGYFEGLQWDAILERSAMPPYVPGGEKDEEPIQRTSSMPIFVGVSSMPLNIVKSSSAQDMSSCQPPALDNLNGSSGLLENPSQDFGRQSSRMSLFSNIEEALSSQGYEVPEPPDAKNDLSCFDGF